MSCTNYIIQYSKVGSIYEANYNYIDCNTHNTVSVNHTSSNSSEIDTVNAVPGSLVILNGALDMDPPSWPISSITGNILVSQPFTTVNDYTVSFTYTLNPSGADINNLYGFSVFFIDGSIQGLTGGGYGPGLGAVSTTGSAVSGIFAVVGFDISGNFSQYQSISTFQTGYVSAFPLSVGVRVNPTFTFVSAWYTGYNAPYMYGPGTTKTVRVCVRKGFSEIDVYYVNGLSYLRIGTFNFNILNLPKTAKVGIGYSGDPYFQVQNITANYT